LCRRSATRSGAARTTIDAAAGVRRPAQDFTSSTTQKPSQSFEAERQGFLRLKILDVAHRVAVSGAARRTAHLELGRKIQVNCRFIGCVGIEFDILEYLALLTSRSFAVRTPIEMHKVLVNVKFGRR
jgi:hypothetical protein